MEWIRISRNKLKIMLTAEDTKRYELRPDSASLESAGTRKAFRAILSDAGKELGFDAADERVYIQLFPSREGGCELFVTKEAESAKEAPTPRPKAEKAPEEHTRHLAFSFPELSPLLLVCRRLTERRYQGESRALRDDEGRYWLLLSDTGNPLLARHEYRFILEYGQMEHGENARLLLLEHGTPLCGEKAVEQLGQL